MNNKTDSVIDVDAAIYIECCSCGRKIYKIIEEDGLGIIGTMKSEDGEHSNFRCKRCSDSEHREPKPVKGCILHMKSEDEIFCPYPNDIEDLKRSRDYWGKAAGEADRRSVELLKKMESMKVTTVLNEITTEDLIREIMRRVGMCGLGEMGPIRKEVDHE